MATRHSSRPSGRAPSKSKSRPETAAEAKQQAATAWKKQARSGDGAAPKKETTKARLADLDKILEHFGQALALVETSHNVLTVAQENWEGEDALIGCPAVNTLEAGCKALLRIYSEMAENADDAD